MKKWKLLLCLIALVLVFPMAIAFAEPDNGNTELTEIKISGNIETEKLTEGPLPAFTVTTETENVSIEAYGENTKWAKLEDTNGTWSVINDANPTAEAGPFYAMRLKVTVSDGYVLTTNTKIIYNDRDMSDTFSSITINQTGGYVYVDLGQIQQDLGPAIEGNVVKRVELEVELPRIGDKIELINNPNEYFQTKVDIRLPKDVPYFLNNNENEDYMYIIDSETNDLFSGTIIKDHLYGIVIWLKLDENYQFANDLTVYLNGNKLEDFNFEGTHKLGLQYMFYPDKQKVTYTVTSADGAATVIFKFNEGNDFVLNFVDILSYTPEQIEQIFGVPADYISEAVNKIKNNVKEYGDLLNLYAIDIEGPQFNYSGEVTLRIKMTDAMKKYNTFKFIFLDENNEFTIQEVHDVTIDGDYLVVHLDHLSAYALVGTNTTNGNPLTADKIVFYVVMLVLCITGVVGSIIYTKKKYFEK